MEQWFNVGKIVNTHGIQGEVRVISSTDFAEQRFAIGQASSSFFTKESISCEAHNQKSSQT